MTEKLIIHFQEGFAGETVELWRGNKRLGRWEMRTRLQIGMAHIEEIDAEPGVLLRLTLPDTGAQASFAAPGPDGAHVILVNHDGQELRVNATKNEPGYL